MQPSICPCPRALPSRRRYGSYKVLRQFMSNSLLLPHHTLAILRLIHRSSLAGTSASYVPYNVSTPVYTPEYTPAYTPVVPCSETYTTTYPISHPVYTPPVLAGGLFNLFGNGKRRMTWFRNGQ
ncbi:hypothetical protein BCR34DRAFT_219111 [Clohesyomyces aquaticus]|uniref:Uncharacterized protein n=1 Tax=Clohesyomyces aquaticus TaxID=1231657 RepID=A0A1Y1Y9S2_9PLEO|nr:hypothetical protein BCR34DRAFT_219111 [Clohesyomyces aquaticus]